MKNLINLNSAEWCDIIFENRNKEYGAYAMRQTSSRRHIVAFGFILLLVALVASASVISGNISAYGSESLGGIDDPYTLTKVVEVNIPEEVIIPIVEKIELPKLAATEKFTPPVIVDDELLNKDNVMKSVDEVLSNKLIVSTVYNPDGSMDKDAVLPEDLKINNTIAGMGTEVIDKPITFAEIMPQFAGGVAEMYKFISSNLRYPVTAQENGIQGRVVIRFVVGKTGDISDITVIRGIDGACDKEAMRVVQKMPRWIPGKQNGIPVPVYFTLPIVFRLS